MIKAAFVAVSSAALVLALACDSGAGEGQRPPEPTVSQEPEATAAPEAGVTGMPEVDDVLETVFSGNEEAVRALIRYSQVACETEPMGIGAPPQCNADEPEGTLVDVFPQSQCEGFYVRPEDMGSAIAALAEPGADLRAVVASEGGWPPGDHIAIYDHVGEPGRAHIAFLLILDGGGIAGIQWGCGQTVDELIENRGLEELLFYAPARGPTGIGDLDFVLDALTSGSPDAVRPFVRYQVIACSTTPDGIDAPPRCRPDEEAGMRVEVFPLRTCELEYRRRDEMDDVRGWLADADLHAVYATQGAHRVVMRWAPPDDDLVLVATVEGRGIVAVDSCGRSAYDVLDGVPPQDILVGPLWP